MDSTQITNEITKLIADYRKKRAEELGPMKYVVEEKVYVNINGETLLGKIAVADFGGSFENTNHSYDVLVEESNPIYGTRSVLHKHIPEESITSAFYFHI